ncbi:MAG TPA: tetratricopeptide repeat protein, partial [Terriglobales bacterium]
PDLGLLRESFKVFPRRRRIRELEAIILDNPAPGNYEELADLLLEEKKYARARECFNKSIAARTDSPDPFYRRALCELEMKDYRAAEPDLRRVIAADPGYDYLRAKGLLAHALTNLGNYEEAESLYRDALRTSTLSETMTNYASFLLTQGRIAEAREWAERVLAKKRTLPSYLKRRERPWFRRAAGVLKQLPS